MTDTDQDLEAFYASLDSQLPEACKAGSVVLSGVAYAKPMSHWRYEWFDERISSTDAYPYRTMGWRFVMTEGAP